MLSIAQRTITQSSVASRPSNYERLVRALLRDCLITAPPVDLGIICDRAHISLERSFLPDTVSGFLYNQDGRTIIGVNPRHSTRRQRFTIAHELAHFFLGHQGDGVHVDKNLALFRDSDQVSDVKESAANLCAAELLMPKQFLIKDLPDLDAFDFQDDNVLDTLADRYEVSHQALLLRFSKVGILL